MRPPRRAVKLKTKPKRAKRDTSHMLLIGESGFIRNEWLETLLRIKCDQPKRYDRETSAGLKVTVSRYETLKTEHERRSSDRAAKKGREADGRSTKRVTIRRTHRAAGQS
jgi:hypothetical protein